MSADPSLFGRALAAELRAQRAGLNLSCQELSAVSGIAYRTVVRTETCQTHPKAEQIAQLVFAMGFTLSEFYSLVEARMARSTAKESL